jgi:hypothetical protein
MPPQPRGRRAPFRRPTCSPVFPGTASPRRRRGRRPGCARRTRPFQAAAIDRVLELLPGYEAVCPLRTVGPEEKPENLPPHARDLTPAGHLRRLHEESLPQARRDLDQATARHDLLARQEPLWPQLLALASARPDLHAQTETRTGGRAAVSNRVEAEATAARVPAEGNETPFTARCRAALRERDDALAQSSPLKERLDVRERELKAEVETPAALRPPARPRKGKEVL